MAPRVLVIGLGAVGIVYTYVLTRAIPEGNIVAVCRSNRLAAEKDGFRLDSAVWGDNLRIRPVIVGSVYEAAKSQDHPFDFIIIAAKCIPSVPPMHDAIRPAVSTNTSIVLLQNGIGIETPYAELYPDNPIISVCVYVSCVQTSPAVTIHNDVQKLHIGTYPASAPVSHKEAAAQLAVLFKTAGAAVYLPGDVQEERWGKMLINGAWNPICALTRSGDASFLASHKDAVQLVREVMLEISSIARGCGYTNINAALVETQLERAIARSPPGVSPSMMIDVIKGRNMEVNALVGNILNIAVEKRVNTPLLRTIYLLINGLDASFKH